MRLRLRELMDDKAARDGKPVLQRHVADATGISQQRFSVILRNKSRGIRFDHAAKLATFFDVGEDELFDWNPETDDPADAQTGQKTNDV